MPRTVQRAGRDPAEEPLDLRLLRAFVVVAEERHFGRAAERLAIAQSPLSRQIMQLETRMGVRLFERDARRVDLTFAGQMLLAEAYPLLEHAAAVSAKVRAMVRPEKRCA
jgi:DNA-binding transcriptional LysR family regulator